MTLGPIVLLLQATAVVPADRGIYPDLDARAEVEAAGWRIRGGQVLRRGAGGGDADGDGIPDAVDILLGAKKVALDGAIYRETAPRLPYPGGDVPRQEGVCTDVVIRALRNAGIDLQRAVHDDAGRAPWAYPTATGAGCRSGPRCSRGTCCSWTRCRRCPTRITWASPAIDATTWGCPG
jgi:hypothetical protein